jgi:hypothetical protein
VAFDGGGSIRHRPCNNQPVQQEGSIMRGQEVNARGQGNASISFVVFCHATSAICSVVVYCATMALRGIIDCRTTMAIPGIIFGHIAMAIGSIGFFSLIATGIHGIVFRHSTLVVGIVVFCRATPLLVICCSTTADHGNAQQTQQSAKRGMHSIDLFDC